MSTTTLPSNPVRPPRSFACILAAGLVVGTNDIVFAIVFWAIKADVPARRILQSVASGLLGPASFEGGARTAALGLALHFFIATSMATAWYVVAQRWAPARRHPVRLGAVYGLFLFLVMNRIVVPLSAAGPPNADPLWVGMSVAVHVLLIGIPIALIVGRGLGTATIHDQDPTG